jgi:Icc-related predicted phosphoesterase
MLKLANCFKKLLKGHEEESLVSLDKAGFEEPDSKSFHSIEENEIYNLDLSGTEPKGHFNVVTIADCHGTLEEKELLDIKVSPDVVILLGDNAPPDLDIILKFFSERNKRPLVIGITGNRDEEDLLRKHYLGKITDLHMNKLCYGAAELCGYDGSLKYKPDTMYALHTNEESERDMASLPSCNILITHDKPCFEKKSEIIDAHAGLTGIGDYIKKNKPSLVLHGHLHERYITEYENTTIRCCYRVEEFSVKL